MDWVVEEVERSHLDDVGGMMVSPLEHSPLVVGCWMVPGLKLSRLGRWCWRWCHVVALELLMATGLALEMVHSHLGGWARWMAMHQRCFVVDLVALVV